MIHHYLLSATTEPTVNLHANVAWAVSILVGFAAAHVGSLLTKLHADQMIKAGVTFILATAAGIIPTVVWAPNASWEQWLLDVFSALMAQVAMHYVGATNPIAYKTASIGLGQKSPRYNKPPKA